MRKKTHKEKNKKPKKKKSAEIVDFIKKSKEWQPHNTENDTNIFIVQQIRDVDTFAQTWAEKILTKVCDNEKKISKKGDKDSSLE